MPFPVRRFAAPALTAVSLAAVLASVWILPATVTASGPADDTAIQHVLNRLGYGARPGDIDRVRRVGVLSYIDQQLHPERIDDGAVEARLRALPTLDMSTAEIARQYVLPALLEKRRDKKDQGDVDPGDPSAPRPQPTAAMKKQRQVMVDLNGQKILRATYSERQLQEVLTDFWFNHFNVFAGKGPERIMLTAYERDTIRPHVLGHFRDLLGATAHSPAMLFYLDNWMSADPDGAMPANAKRPAGLNENYGRELMELHTLGVDGGYTQKDVVEVARAFTGWTIDRPRQGGGFRFAPGMHDDGEKHVLGHTIRAGGGERDGEQVLDILARHPSTAKFIATKLARRFVGDDPPRALVDRAAKRFLDTDSDIREVVRLIITSPEFLSADAYGTKVKSPFEFMVSALRATSAEVMVPGGLLRAQQQLGMPPYQAQPPTGYGDTAETWVNTGALVSRMNFAVDLMANRVAGVRVNSGPTAIELGGPEFQKR